MMAKKNWIYIKRGLSEDPKHRIAMGECVWLYMHLVDMCDWETGIVYGWKDEQGAAEMSMQLPTIRHQRRKLQQEGYIKAVQKRHGQDLIITNWTNPREYSGKVKNPKSDNELPPSSDESDNQGDSQGDNEGDNHPSSQIITPTYNSESESKPLSPDSVVFSYYSNNIAMLVPASRDEIGELLNSYAEDWIIEAIDIAVKNNVRKLSYIRGVLGRWERHGKQDPKKPIEPTFTNGAFHA